MNNYDLIVILEKKLNRGNILTQDEISILATNSRIEIDSEVLSKIIDSEKEATYIENMQNIRSIRFGQIYDNEGVLILNKDKKN